MILINNQYPPMFFEPIIHRTLTKILTPVDKEDGDVSEIDINETVVEEDNDDGSPPLDCQRVFKSQNCLNSLFKCEFFQVYKQANEDWKKVDPTVKRFYVDRSQKIRNEYLQRKRDWLTIFGGSRAWEEMEQIKADIKLLKDLKP